MVDWISFFGSQPESEKTSLNDFEAANIPIYEAIHLSQCATTPRDNEVYIETQDDRVLNFPEPVPSIHVGDTDVNFYLGQDHGLDAQLNPLLSPSVRLMENEVPSFFKTDRKYLARKRHDVDKSGDINQVDRIALTTSSFEDKLREPLTTHIVAMYLRRNGYIVDRFNESLATPGGGYPDLFAIKLPDYQQTLYDAGLTGGGFYLNELELPWVDQSTNTVPEEQEVAVLEVESVRDGSFYDAKDETHDYLEGGWFDTGYGVRGFAEQRLQSWTDRLDVGFITFNENGEFTTHPCSGDFGDTQKTRAVRDRVRTIVKLTLLKNLPLADVLAFLDVNSFYDTVAAAEEVSLQAVLNRLESAGKV